MRGSGAATGGTGDGSGSLLWFALCSIEGGRTIPGGICGGWADFVGSGCSAPVDPTGDGTGSGTGGCRVEEGGTTPGGMRGGFTPGGMCRSCGWLPGCGTWSGDGGGTTPGGILGGV
jgi:hypothetical protein